MRTGNAQVARMGGVARMGRARAPRATQNSRYELNCYKGRRKDASRAKLFKCPPRDTSLISNVPEYVNLKFANYMSFEMHPRDALSTVIYE